jgi:hypothetical protein
MVHVAEGVGQVRAAAGDHLDVARAAADPGVDRVALAEPGLQPERGEPAALDEEPQEAVAQQGVLADEVRALAARTRRHPSHPA